MLEFGFEYFTVSNVMFFAGTSRVQCSLFDVVLCDSLYIGI